MNTALDPVQAAFYGQFVAAAYEMYRVDEKDLRPAAKKIPAGWELSAWINMSDFLFQITEPKFYGIVVHEVEKPDNRIIAIRGTEGIVEWLDDAASILMVPFRQVPSAGRVAFGFDNIYSTMKVVPVPHAAAGVKLRSSLNLLAPLGTSWSSSRCGGRQSAVWRTTLRKGARAESVRR